jgi:excisionase family DNA binding protein
MSELLTVQELAEYLRVTIKTIYRLLEKDKVPATRVGHLWRFDKTAIDEWLRQNSKPIKAKILIIDDDPSIGILFNEALQDTGHTISTATDSAKGLDLVINQNFDLVFLDLIMPGTDGAATFKRIRDIRPELPVTIITGYPDGEMMMSAMAIGPFSVIKKPFASSDIISAVNNYLRFGMAQR